MKRRRARWRRSNWWVLGWHKGHVGRRLSLHVSLCLSNFNRPLVSIGREYGSRFVAIGWGNGQSDPAWQIEVDINE